MVKYGDDAASDLGAFLRARREALQPEDVGVPRGYDRRVPGLRREEVALLSGVSVDYINRIEQGRERTPSAQILDALARALHIDEHGRMYLARLIRPDLIRESRSSEASSSIRDLLDGLVTFPAYVVDPAMNILAMNRLAEALYAGFDRTDNLLRMIFMDPHATEFYLDWPHTAEGVVRNLRASVAENPGYAKTSEVVGELVVRSPAFAEQWMRHEVRPRTLEDKAFRHPVVGELHLRFQTLSIDESSGQRLYVYPAPVSSSSEAAMQLLAALTTPTRPQTSTDVEKEAEHQ